MLEIKACTDIEKYIDVIEKLSLDADLCQAVESFDKGEVSGFGICHFAGDAISVDFVESHGDLLLFDGIARSILFKAMLAGIDKAVFGNEQLGKFKMLGLCGDDGRQESITELLDHCKNCEK